MGGVVALRLALEPPDLVRRLVLVATSGGTARGTWPPTWRGASLDSPPRLQYFLTVVQPQLTPREGRRPMKMRLSLMVNGESHDVLVPVHKTLLEVLREDLDLIGTKHG